MELETVEGTCREGMILVCEAVCGCGIGIASKGCPTSALSLERMSTRRQNRATEGQGRLRSSQKVGRTGDCD